MKKSSFIKSILVLIAILGSFALQAIEILSPGMQNKILKALTKEMIRLDGEALVTRKHRTESFQVTTEKIAKEALNNKSLLDFYNSFQKLNATYTNLHSKVIFSPDIEQQIKLPWHKNQSVWMFIEVGKNHTSFKVSRIEDPGLKNIIALGDEIVAINGRSIKSWLDENFLFCKYPLAIQCHRQFEQGLLSLSLSWKGNTDLIYSIKHDEEVVDVKIAFLEDMPEQNPLRKRCDYDWEKRYSGFKIIHTGYSACLYEKIDNPSIGLLRITSFMYSRKDPANPFKSVREEVQALEKVWLPKAGQYKNLIIDVLNNGGGNIPVAYYEILFKGKFQEQYYQTKKTPEFEDQRLRAAMIWDDPSHELQYQEYLTSGLWDALNYGDFTPPEPMFCADENKACIGPLYEARDHDFSGNVSVMLNENCVSSCDGFVSAVKEHLSAELYGFYQAADTTYSRLRIDVIKDDSHKDGFVLKINPQYDPLPKDLLVAQVVATTLSTDAEGNIFSGNPIELKEFIPYKFGEYYPSVVLKAILEQIKL